MWNNLQYSIEELWMITNAIYKVLQKNGIVLPCLVYHHAHAESTHETM